MFIENQEIHENKDKNLKFWTNYSIWSVGVMKVASLNSISKLAIRCGS